VVAAEPTGRCVADLGSRNRPPLRRGSPSYELTTFRQPVEYLVGEAIRRILDPDAHTPGSLMAPGSLVLRSSHRRSAD
jgi:DNA-binding LacI/PurR family transcriptional regulator